MKLEASWGITWSCATLGKLNNPSLIMKSKTSDCTNTLFKHYLPHYYHCYATCLSWWPRKLATMLQNTSHLIFLFSDFPHSLVFTSRELWINFQFSFFHFDKNCVFSFTFSHTLPNLPIIPKSRARAQPSASFSLPGLFFYFYTGAQPQKKHRKAPSHTPNPTNWKPQTPNPTPKPPW